MSSSRFDYTPPPTLRRFMRSDAFVRFVIGPLGSAKTTAMIMELLRRSVEQAPTARGVRPTRWAIVRNTLPQLKQTIVPDIRQLLEPLGVKFRVGDKEIHFKFPLSDGTTVHSEWLMIPIETIEDTRRLLSLQLTGAWVAEFRETKYEIIAALMGRVGRYPSKAVVNPTWQGLIGESNPFSMGSEWYKHLVEDLPDGWELYQQPSGLSDEAENRENLPDDYYERLMDGHSSEWIKVHVHGQFGDDMSGEAVFARDFNYEFHTRPHLNPIRELPIMIAVDFGRTPAAVFSQVDPRGRLLVLHEEMAENMGPERFGNEHIVPTMSNRFQGMRCFVVCDPSGTYKQQVGEITPAQALGNAGLTVQPAPTNDLDPRLRAVEALLSRQMDGEGAMLIDRAHCPNLISALQHNYRYRRKKTGDVEEKPDKNHPWSDLADCLQYLACSMGTKRVGVMMGYRKQAPPPPRISAAGWT